MTFEDLRVFVTVASERSFSRAARKLRRTQPAVSQAIRRLEDAAGERLIDRSSRDGTLTDAVMEMTRRVGKDAFLRQHKALMERADSRPSLSGINVPTLVLCGRQDAMTPPARHTEIADAIPNSRLVLIEDSGHLTTMERPQAATALLRDWMLYDR